MVIPRPGDVRTPTPDLAAAQANAPITAGSPRVRIALLAADRAAAASVDTCAKQETQGLGAYARATVHQLAGIREVRLLLKILKTGH